VNRYPIIQPATIQPNPRIGRPARRAASVLICVLITLIVTGLLITQSYRMLAAASRTQRQLLQTEQGSELLLLGKQLIEHRLVSDSLYSGESIVVQLVDSNGSAAQSAQIVISKSSTGPASKIRWDLAVSYPVKSPQLFTATWETHTE